MNYRWIREGQLVRRLDDGKPEDQCPVIPADPGNQDWRAFEAWRAAGGEPLPAPPAEGG